MSSCSYFGLINKLCPKPPCLVSISMFSLPIEVYYPSQIYADVGL